MPKLSDLGLGNEQVGEVKNYADVPDQMGGFNPPPQPGTFRFKFPARMDDLWEVFDHPNGKPPGKRLRAKFDDAHPLLIIQSPNNAYNGEPFLTGISNAERPRGKKDDANRPMVSDIDYILRDVRDVKTPPKTNPQYATEFQKLAGTEMTADVEWSWFCNDKKDIFIELPPTQEGGLPSYAEQQGVKGCKASYYQQDVKDANYMVLSNPEDPNSPKVFPLRIPCQCGASLRAFANLTRFRK